MNELNESFENYINELKKLPIEEKRTELINSIKELLAGFEYLAQQNNIELHYLKNNEILDLNKENVTEDDFIEAAVVYVEVAKNVIGDFFDKINNDI